VFNLGHSLEFTPDANEVELSISLDNSDMSCTIIPRDDNNIYKEIHVYPDNQTTIAVPVMVELNGGAILKYDKKSNTVKIPPVKNYTNITYGDLIATYINDYCMIKVEYTKFKYEPTSTQYSLRINKVTVEYVSGRSIGSSGITISMDNTIAEKIERAGTSYFISPGVDKYFELHNIEFENDNYVLL
jgi:hypothetical protein